MQIFHVRSATLPRRVAIPLRLLNMQCLLRIRLSPKLRTTVGVIYKNKRTAVLVQSARAVR